MRIVVVGSASLALAVPGAAPARAARPDAAGYWSQVPIGTTPAGGLEVAATGYGRVPSSIAAIRATGGPTTVTLVEASAVVPPGVDPVVIQACPATKPWSPADRGAWADAPTFDCAKGFDNLERVERDGKVLWIAEVERFVTRGAVDVVLVTGPGRGPFTVSFQPPDESTIAVAPAPAPAAFDAAPAADLATSDPNPAVGTAAPVAAPVRELGLSDAGALLTAPAISAVKPPSAPAPADTIVTSTRPTAVQLPEGTRSPLALMAVAVALAAWGWRFRVASARAAAHPLSASLVATEGLGSGTALVEADEDRL